MSFGFGFSSMITMLPEATVINYVKGALDTTEKRSELKKTTLAGVQITEILQDERCLSYRISSAFLSQNQHVDIVHGKTTVATPSAALKPLIENSNVKKALTLEETVAFAKEFHPEEADLLTALAHATKELAVGILNQEEAEESSNSQDSKKRSPESSRSSSPELSKRAKI